MKVLKDKTCFSLYRDEVWTGENLPERLSLQIFFYLFNTDGADTDSRGRLFHRAHGHGQRTTSLVLQKVYIVSNAAKEFDLFPEMHYLINSVAR